MGLLHCRKENSAAHSTTAGTLVCGSLVGRDAKLFFKKFVPSLALSDSQLVHIPSTLFSSFQMPDFTVFTSGKWMEPAKYALFIAFMAFTLKPCYV